MGSVRGLSDASGNVVDTYSYDAYGMLLDKTSSTINPYRYRDEQYDSDLDAYYLRARYYQPGVGRFLTTDPVEGVPIEPLSQHRYLYGNADPVGMIDPSGNMSLPEQLVTAGIVMNLAGMSTVPVSNTLQSVYSYFAKEVFPEAYVIGFNLIGTTPWDSYFSYVIEEIANSLNLSIFLPMISYAPYMHTTIGGGGELLLNVGSGEAAVFRTISFGGIFTLPTFAVGFEAYDGFVFNLWNAYDYHGPFGSFSLSLGKKIGMTLFWDAKRKFDGPWGGASTFISKSFGLQFPWNFGIGRTNIDYEIIGPPKDRNRSELICAIMRFTMLSKAVAILQNQTPLGLGFGLLESTTWINIGLAHHYWNIKEREYNLDARRHGSKRPDKYRSGPYLFNMLF